ncbi:MAG: hypothetical protein JSW25_05320, partial [Thermoplasmata archaeon]
MKVRASSQVTVIICLLILSSSQILLEDVDVTAAPGEPGRDRLLKVAGSYIIEDHQVWGSVLVHPGGRLIVANGGHLETGYIHLNPRSVMEVRSGQLTMEAHSHTD